MWCLRVEPNPDERIPLSSKFCYSIRLYIVDSNRVSRSHPFYVGDSMATITVVRGLRRGSYVKWSSALPYFTPNFFRVAASALPVAGSPFAFWNFMRASWVCGPIFPSTLTL